MSTNEKKSLIIKVDPNEGYSLTGELFAPNYIEIYGVFEAQYDLSRTLLTKAFSLGNDVSARQYFTKGLMGFEIPENFKLNDLLQLLGKIHTATSNPIKDLKLSESQTDLLIAKKYLDDNSHG